MRHPGYERVSWRIAVRIRLGLDPRPALLAAGYQFTPVGLSQCSNRYKTGDRAGQTCQTKSRDGRYVATAHDGVGRHAMGCKVGGGVIGDRDLLRDMYATVARPLYVSLDAERYIHELAQVNDDGEWREARMDLVGRTAATGTRAFRLRPSGGFA